MSHTPGPWTACKNGKCKCKGVMSENHPIAQVISGEWGDEYPDVRLVEWEDGIGKHAEAYIEKIVYGTVDPDFAEANARLIALAPEMYAACETICQTIEKWMDFGERPCPFCGHHHIHDHDCLYSVISGIVAKVEGDE